MAQPNRTYPAELRGPRGPQCCWLREATRANLGIHGLYPQNYSISGLFCDHPTIIGIATVNSSHFNLEGTAKNGGSEGNILRYSEALLVDSALSLRLSRLSCLYSRSLCPDPIYPSVAVSVIGQVEHLVRPLIVSCCPAHQGTAGRLT